MRQPTSVNPGGNQTVDLNSPSNINQQVLLTDEVIKPHQTEKQKVPNLLQQLDPYG